MGSLLREFDVGKPGALARPGEQGIATLPSVVGMVPEQMAPFLAQGVEPTPPCECRLQGGELTIADDDDFDALWHQAVNIGQQGALRVTCTVPPFVTYPSPRNR